MFLVCVSTHFGLISLFSPFIYFYIYLHTFSLSEALLSTPLYKSMCVFLYYIMKQNSTEFGRKILGLSFETLHIIWSVDVDVIDGRNQPGTQSTYDSSWSHAEYYLMKTWFQNIVAALM